MKWISQLKNKDILLAFSAPNIPARVEKELCIKKLKLRPFLDKKLLEPLNPKAKKGRFYILSDRARKLLKVPKCRNMDKNWNLIGWLISSPRQRLAILRVMDEGKRNSEIIRARATQFNVRMTRVSAKGILKELIARGLVETEINERKRLYWLNELGINMKHQVGVTDSFSPLFLRT
jgi:hypothetical protein